LAARGGRQVVGRGTMDLAESDGYEAISGGGRPGHDISNEPADTEANGTCSSALTWARHGRHNKDPHHTISARTCLVVRGTHRGQVPGPLPAEWAYRQPDVPVRGRDAPRLPHTDARHGGGHGWRSSRVMSRPLGTPGSTRPCQHTSFAVMVDSRLSAGPGSSYGSCAACLPGTFPWFWSPSSWPPTTA